MRNKIFKAFAILCCITYSIIGLTSLSVLAQSEIVTDQPEKPVPAFLSEGPVPSEYITGYVFDEDGKPVPEANVSLWQNGQLWTPGKHQLAGVENPQASLPSYSIISGVPKEGSFLFGFTAPGEYTLTAEKDGYKGEPVSVHVGEETLSANRLEAIDNPVMVNITLTGYHMPTLSSDQQSYTGAIAGTIKTARGYDVTGVNVSLLQDGVMVDRPDNPQSSFHRNLSGKRIDYLFHHLAPGRYTVKAEYFAGADFNDTVTLDMDTKVMRADIVLSKAYMSPLEAPAVIFTPIVGEFDAAEPVSTPATSWLIVMLLIVLVATWLDHKR
ncbi:carboxypeptidase regulatory-like domain-containing protein [Methanocella arvoryzae]|nr:carboxypeptidase regulatory-like domain-containing protein [Methanocella arvoryzae]